MMRSPGNNIEHLHFVLNDPANFSGYPEQSCILVSATTIRAPKYDATCVLEPGCHRFITQPSYIAYSFAFLKPAAALELGVQCNLFREHDQASEELTRRILACMDASPRTSQEFRRLAVQAWNLLPAAR